MPRIYKHIPDRKTVLRSRLVRHYALKAMPPIDLRSSFPLPPFDQGQWGTCGANAAAAVLTFGHAAQGDGVEMFSRLFIYAMTRTRMGIDLTDDSGVTNEDLVTALQVFGACAEAQWPYDDAHFAAIPDVVTFGLAQQDLALAATPLTQDLDTLYGALEMHFPVIFGIGVYSSFEDATVALTGDVPAPDTFSEALLGGHDIVLCGLDVAANRAIFRNSWGNSWGRGGYGTLPINEYLLNPNLANSFWAVKKIGPKT